MRKTLWIIVFLILGVTINAWAVDFTTVNKESMQVFVELLPDYKALVQEMEVASEQGASFKKAAAHKEKIDALFAQYDISFEEFPVFLQKVSMGYARAQMQKSDMPAGMMDMMGQMGQGLSEKEMAVIEDYSAILEKIFSE